MEWFRIYLVIFGVLCVCSNRVRSAEAKPVTKVKAFRIGVNRFWLHCFPRGKQAINGRKFEWFYNGTALKPNKRIKIRGSNTWVRIQKPTAQDVGKYSCKEILAGNDRKTLSIFHVKIDQSTLEFINKNRPKNKIVLSGDTTTLYCNATGTQPIKYKWYKNNKKIRRTSRPYLILKNLKTTDSAKYSCKAKNKVLNIRYDVNLDVKARARVSPYIEKDGDDDDGKAIVGSTASLSCYELQSPTLPKFVWLKWKGAANLTVLNKIAESSNNLVDYASMVEILPADRYKQVSKKAFRLRDPEHRIHGVDLLFPDVTLFDRGFYTCLVSNQAGYDYKITYFNIERSQKPRISKDITDLTEKIGDDVEIKCFILGEGPPNVTWYKDDVLIGEFQLVSKFEQQSHISVFKVSNFKSADAGNYKCRAKNAFGEDSHTFKLVPMVTNNNTVPKIIKESKTTYHVGIGEDLEIQIQYVVKGIAHTQLLLYCGGQTNNPLCAGGRKTLSGTFRVLDVPRIMVSEGDNHTVMLSFKKINESLFGNYSVFVGNALGYDFINVTIKPAAAKPEIQHMRTTTFITQLGVDFMFPECKVVIQSKSLAKIIWKKSFSDIASSERHIVRENKLMIKDVRYSDAGYYTCNARNSAGEDQVRLILKVWPLVINKTSPALVTRLGRGTVEIFCSAYGNTRSMTGTIENAGYPVPYVVKTTKDNLFMVKVNVTDDGTFVCTIQSGKEKAQSATVVEQFHLKSAILNSTSIEHLGKWLKEAKQLGRYRACWDINTTLPMNSGGAFYTLDYCGGKKNTISLIQVRDRWSSYLYYHSNYPRAWDKTLGGFSDKPWLRGQSQDSDKAFMFEFNPPKKYAPRYGGKNAICGYGTGPCFGNKNLYMKGYPGSAYGTRGNIWFGKSKAVFDIHSLNFPGGYRQRMEVFYRVD